MEALLPTHMRTRAANANKHPAAHLAPKHCVKGAPTKAAQQEEVKAAKLALVKASVTCIAGIERRNAKQELSNQTPHTSSSTKKRTYADAVSSGSEGKGEGFKKSFHLDSPSKFEPSQLNNVGSEAATTHADSTTEDDSEAFKPASGSVTEEDSVTKDDTPPATPKKKQSKVKAAKLVLGDNSLDFDIPPAKPSPPAKKTVVKPALPKVDVNPLPPKKRGDVKPSAKILVAAAAQDSDKPDGPSKKKMKVPQGGVKLASASSKQPQPEVSNAKVKVSKPKSTFRNAVKEEGHSKQVYIKTEPGGSDDEQMVSIQYLSRHNIS